MIEGAALGLALTLGVAVLTFALQRKLPYKKMLIVTGVLIGVVLVVMVGQTARTMQGTGWLPITPLDWDIPSSLGLWMGVFPSVETLLAQVAAIVFVIGSYVRRDRAQGQAPAAQGRAQGREAPSPSRSSRRRRSRASAGPRRAAARTIVLAAAPAEPLVLVFTKTTGYRHDSIPARVATIEQLGRRHGFRVDHTEDAGRFTRRGLARYDAVVFLVHHGRPARPDRAEASAAPLVERGGGLLRHPCRLRHRARLALVRPPRRRRASAATPPGTPLAIVRVARRERRPPEVSPRPGAARTSGTRSTPTRAPVRVLATVDERTYAARRQRDGGASPDRARAGTGPRARGLRPRGTAPDPAPSTLSGTCSSAAWAGAPPTSDGHPDVNCRSRRPTGCSRAGTSTSRSGARPSRASRGPTSPRGPAALDVY